ncbi:MAG TPA: hypothetical protein VG755_10615 [Nannocystaceae bacterium]|nr:hypothetical protein [Nannocystaceae bacterium]
MPKLHALLLCSLLVPACDSSAATPTAAKTDAAKEGGKAGDGKAADAPKQDDAAVIEAAKKAAMSQCSLPPNDFTDAKMQSSDKLVGSILHVWTATGPTPREHKQFVAQKAMVRAVMGDQLDIYITTDGSDPCAVPKNVNINVVSGPFVMTKDGNEVVVVSLADKKPGKYFGRTVQEAMADMMGGPPNWLGISYMVKDAAVKEFKPGDKTFPYGSLNSEGRSHIDVTKVELGKKLEAKIHACLGGEDFLIGPIDAGFCPDAQATP